MLENRIKYIRDGLEITQKELGEILNISRATVNGYENNFDTIPLINLIKFCNIFKYSLDYVMNLSNYNNQYQELIIDRKIISKNLINLRKSLNLKQSDIAKECNITQQNYSQYELGKLLISTNCLYTICKLHKVSVDKLLGRIEEKEKINI